MIRGVARERRSAVPPPGLARWQAAPRPYNAPPPPLSPAQVAFREVEALRRQDQLIAEEFELQQLEDSRRKEQAEKDKEKRAKKKVRPAGWHARDNCARAG